MAEKEKTVYEIRRDGETICACTIPRCGYSVSTLRGMLASGYRYYENGKIQRKV